ncbi:GNAT family N-acetyltransferase [Clavibacter capsici]|uniref:GNAT family N-acetyltransferase n=1 Tax=Clavibacter capsici TaxID=1874630 RepID=UPI001FFC7C01|nr:GNAT family N-acetyltransferase [Clavibacter capsici]
MTRHDDVPAAAPLDRVPWPVRTERLLIRRITATDAPAMWAYRRLDEVTRWVTSRPVDGAAWIAGSAAMLRDQLVLELDGRVVGDLMVRVEDAWGQREVLHLAVGTQAELGWTLDPSVGGRGLATEAVREALRIAFQGLGVRRVVASAVADSLHRASAGSTGSATPCSPRSGRRAADHGGPPPAPADRIQYPIGSTHVLDEEDSTDDPALERPGGLRR